MGASDSASGGQDVTLVWFVIWFVFDRIGDREPLQLDPVNLWTGLLLLALALDLAGVHAQESRGR
jgi:hypothetical protein